MAEISLNSKVVEAYNNFLAPLAVEAVMKVQNSCTDGKIANSSDIKLVTKLG